jgi:hypothetical protein
MILARLPNAGMRVNISKSKFFAQQIEYLGYWITRKGIQPIHNKVEAILDIKVPKIDSLKIQEEKVLKILSGSENNCISNIKLTTPMHTALIFKEQKKVKESGSREKSLAQPHYSIQHIEGYNLLCYKDMICILQSLKQRLLSWYHEYLLHVGQTCHVCQMTKKERKKYGLLAPKIAESDILSLGHGLCRSGGSMCGLGRWIYNKDTSQNTLSAFTHNDRSSH